MKKVLLLLAKGFETYEASVFIDVIGWNMVDGDKSTKLFTCGMQSVVNSSFDQKFQVDYLIDEINVDDFDALAIPGGFGEYNFYDDAYNEKFLNLIRSFHQKNKIVASICVAALAVGKSGILTGKQGTTYGQIPTRQETLKSYGVNVLKQPIVIDDNIVTSWDPSTAIDVALLLLELLTSKQNADNIRKMMGFK